MNFNQTKMIMPTCPKKIRDPHGYIKVTWTLSLYAAGSNN